MSKVASNEPLAWTAADWVSPSIVIETFSGGIAEVLLVMVPARLIDAIPLKIACDGVRPLKLVVACWTLIVAVAVAVV